MILEGREKHHELKSHWTKSSNAWMEPGTQAPTVFKSYSIGLLNTTQHHIGLSQKAKEPFYDSTALCLSLWASQPSKTKNLQLQ